MLLADSGGCEEDDQVIWLSNEFANERTMLEVYYHEALHGIEEEYGVKMTHKDLDRIAQGIVQATLALIEAQ